MKATVGNQRREPMVHFVLPARVRPVWRESPGPRGTASTGTVWLDTVSGVEGFAVAVAMNNVGGAPEFLREVLGRFAALYAAGEPGFLAPPAVDDLPHWRARCHSLRGAAAIVGAVSVTARAEALERALRSHAVDPAEVAVAGRFLHETLKDLSARFAAALERSPHG